MKDSIVCPRCGEVIRLDDPRVRRLTPAAIHAWEKWESALKRGERLGSTRAGALASMTPPAAKKHLERLRTAGLVEAVKKRQDGKYCVYQLAA